METNIEEQETYGKKVRDQILMEYDAMVASLR